MRKMTHNDQSLKAESSYLTLYLLCSVCAPGTVEHSCFCNEALHEPRTYLHLLLYGFREKRCSSLRDRSKISAFISADIPESDPGADSSVNTGALPCRGNGLLCTARVCSSPFVQRRDESSHVYETRLCVHHSDVFTAVWSSYLYLFSVLLALLPLVVYNCVQHIAFYFCFVYCSLLRLSSPSSRVSIWYRAVCSF